MTKLDDAILDALEKYDAVLADDDRGNYEQYMTDCEIAAHGCVEEIRVAFEQEPEEEINLNNPIAQLHERAQVKRCAVPVYEYEFSGMDHSPNVKCICTSEGVTDAAVSTNKQKAKRKASMLVLRTLFFIENEKREGRLDD